MFLEPLFKGQRCGWIEVICGSMFSGKTEELIRRLKRAEIAEQAVVVVKPQVDSRYHEEHVVSHDERAFQGTSIQRATEMIPLVEEAEVVGIDEGQFFDESLPEVCQQLAMDGKRVIVAGLDMDFRGQPFGPMPNLLAVAEYVTKVHAICSHCGSMATHSYRTVPSDKDVLLGEKEAYEARCRVCYNMGNILKLPKTKRDKQQGEEDDPQLF